MNISATKIYERNSKTVEDLTLTDQIQSRLNRIDEEERRQRNLTGHDRLISQNERDFFIKLFPENSEQLQRHTLFNQNGRLQTPNLNKGMIVDGRV